MKLIKKILCVSRDVCYAVLRTSTESREMEPGDDNYNSYNTNMLKGMGAGTWEQNIDLNDRFTLISYSRVSG